MLASAAACARAFPAVAAVALAAALSLQLARWRAAHWRAKRRGFKFAPLDRPWLFFLGDLPGLRRNWARFYDYRREKLLKCGDDLTIAQWAPFWTTQPTVLTVDPDIVRFIFKDEFDTFVHGLEFNRVMRAVLGDAIFSLDHGPHAEDGGNEWMRQRKTSLKIFSRNVFNTSVHSALCRHLSTMAEILDEKSELDLQTLLRKFALDVIMSVGFGVEHGSMKSETEFERAFELLQGPSMRARMLTPFWWTPLGKVAYASERLTTRVTAILDREAYSFIEARRREQRDVDDDLLGLFMRDEAVYDDQALRNILLAFLFAGRDTTSSTLSFAVMLLATYPQEQDTLRAAVRTVLGSRKNRFFTFDDIKACKELVNFVNETMRLHPTVAADARECAVDVALPDGRLLEKGTRVIVDIYAMGRNEKVWGSNANVFRPARWQELDAQPSAYAFPVFAAGPRMCVGMEMAKFVVHIGLAFLVDRYEWAPARSVYTYSPGVTASVKDGLVLRVRKADGVE